MSEMSCKLKGYKRQEVHSEEWVKCDSFMQSFIHLAAHSQCFFEEWKIVLRLQKSKPLLHYCICAPGTQAWG